LLSFASLSFTARSLPLLLRISLFRLVLFHSAYLCLFLIYFAPVDNQSASDTEVSVLFQLYLTQFSLCGSQFHCGTTLQSVVTVVLLSRSYQFIYAHDLGHCRWRHCRPHFDHYPEVNRSQMLGLNLVCSYHFSYIISCAKAHDVIAIDNGHITNTQLLLKNYASVEFNWKTQKHGTF